MKPPIRFLLLLLECVALFLMGCDGETDRATPSRSFAWEVSTPEAQSIDREKLVEGFGVAEQMGFVNSVLIVRHGFLAGERYFNGFGRDDAHNVRSVSKSFLSAMVGIALREDFLLTPDQKALDFFPEYVSRDTDSQKRLITLRHLLQMRAGFDHDHNTFGQLHSSPNWIEATINLPLLFDPGERFSYNTFASHLLSAILTRATEMSSFEFSERYLTGPLGISIADWARDPQGYFFGGTDMFFTSRDLARFGLLYLNGGALDGEQIVPAQWVERSLTGHIQKPDWAWGEIEKLDYGYLWWMGEINGHELFFALGHGGQFVLCVPGLDMVVVISSDSYVDWDTADEQERGVAALVGDYILPAVEK
jgi:CubicO group peptidase (beta-lactamase class C family)